MSRSLALVDKLSILADAAKYDASCASSGAKHRNSIGGKGVGSTEGMGICHAYAPDGRCISLLKILLTNYCMFDCAYCVNRRSSDVRRARFTPAEIATLTIEFYKRNYIEGLFLSSGIIRSPDYTMEQLIEAARLLRNTHDFRGYIHLKTIPEASPELVERAGLYADRLSINVEMPDRESLSRYAPEKDAASIGAAMSRIRLKIDESKEERRKTRRAPSFAAAGQSTQMIIGADETNDAGVLSTSRALYNEKRLRRVYYSAFSPIPHASSALPPKPPPLMREHRLYQADWLLRFYGFELDEIVAGGEAGMLDLSIDPKLAWALKNRDRFPVDINRAPREALLRVPGFGARAVKKILSARRHGAIRYADLVKLSPTIRKAAPFLTMPDWRPSKLIESDALRARFVPPPEQLSLFAA